MTSASTGTGRTSARAANSDTAVMMATRTTDAIAICQISARADAAMVSCFTPANRMPMTFCDRSTIG